MKKRHRSLHPVDCQVYIYLDNNSFCHFASVHKSKKQDVSEIQNFSFDTNLNLY